MFHSDYVAKQADASGYVAYSDEENQTWSKLYARQIPIVESRACEEYLMGLKILNLPEDRIPQVKEMNDRLMAITGWQVEPVPALIPHSKFFTLLSEKKFPAATFIRRKSQFDYITEPDIFHEYFGHCPMITCQAFADFMQKYGELGKKVSEPQQNLLARLYWFTVEFGLIQTQEGLKIYGGGILSSPEETVYSLESPKAKRVKLEVKDALANDFRIDIKQKKYYIIQSFNELYQVLDQPLEQITKSMV